jgi:Tol biopolymer transport system component
VDPARGWSFLYVIGGDLWVTGGGGQSQLTQGAQISHPALTDDSVAFVERQRNASDIWLASADAPLRPVTQNVSPIVSQNHWGSQPVFLPGGQRLYVVGDFNKSSTGPGNLAIWELTLQESAVLQITQPPEYAGGDQDITVDPVNPRQIVFTRYAYAGSRLVEQLQWMDVRADAPVALTPPDQPSRQANYSPDGTALAFIQSGHGTIQDLWIGRIQVGNDGPHLDNVRQAATGVLANPVWSPDGAELAYIALTRDQFQLWTLRVQRDASGAIIGFGQPQQVTSGPGIDATSRPVFMTSEQAARVRDWLSRKTPPS